MLLINTSLGNCPVLSNVFHLNLLEEPACPDDPTAPKNFSCPFDFWKATQLFCHNRCGDDWNNEDDPSQKGVYGCQEEDANAFCKLKLCDETAFPLPGTIKGVDKRVYATNDWGFACDMIKVGDGVTNHVGPFVGIKDVKVDTNVLEHHGRGSVVTATCVKPGKYDSFLRVI